MTAGRFREEIAYLVEAAQEYFDRQYERPGIQVFTELDRNLEWRPSLHFKGPNHQIIAAEATEEPFPSIMKVWAQDVLQVYKPVSVYVICPENAVLAKSNQPHVRNLREYGFGLLTVNDELIVTQQFDCIPLILHIPEQEFFSAIRGITRKAVRLRVKDAFRRYQTGPRNAVQELRQLLEDLVNGTVREAIDAGHLPAGVADAPLANKVDELQTTPGFTGSRAELAGVRHFIATYGNPASHAPRTATQAYQELEQCKVGFRTGVQIVKGLEAAILGSGYRLRFGTS